MGEIVSITAADGHQLDAYRARPGGTPKGGVVLIQEIFGITPHMERLCDSFAAAGYTACAPALFDRLEKNLTFGYDGDQYTAAHAARARLTDEWILADCRASVAYLAPAGKVGLAGYCFGGYVAWIAGTDIKELACSVSLYGGGVVRKLDRVPVCPMQFHVGDHDRAVPLGDIAKIKEAHPDIPFFVYDDAGHGFCTDDREGAFQPAACRRATGRVLDFLGEHVG